MKYKWLEVVFLCIIIFLIGFNIVNIYDKFHGIEKKEFNNNNFALMIKNEDGSETPINEFPENFILSEARCYDRNEHPITAPNFKYNSRTRELKANNFTNPIFCYLYFEKDDSGFSFYLGGSTNPEYTQSSNITAYLKWNSNEVTSYCLSESSTDCNRWYDFSTSEKNNLEATVSPINLSGDDGPKTYYAFLKNSSDTITESVADDIILDTKDPTCSLSITSSGISFSTKYDNLKLVDYYINYNGSYQNSFYLSKGTYYGYVRDASGREGHCNTTISDATYQSGSSTLYNMTSYECRSESTESCYNATKETSSGCPSDYPVALANDKCGKRVGAVTKQCPSGTEMSPSTGLCRIYHDYDPCPSGYKEEFSGSSTPKCCKGNDCRDRQCPKGYSPVGSGEYRCWKNSGKDPVSTCSSGTAYTDGYCYITTSKPPAQTTYKCNSGGTLKGTQCCSTTYKYSFRQLNKISDQLSCRASTPSCSSSRDVGNVKVECQSYSVPSQGGYYCYSGTLIPGTQYCHS